MAKQLPWVTATIVFFLVNTLFGDLLDHWQFRSTNSFNCIRGESGPFGFVGVGANGARMTSVDGIFWVGGNAATNNLNDIAVGRSETMIIDPPILDEDGNEWEPGQTNFIRNLFLVVGDRGTTSFNNPVPIPTTNDLVSAAYGNGMFIISTKTPNIAEPNFYIYNWSNVLTRNLTNFQYEPSPWEPVVLGLPDLNLLFPGQGVGATPRYFKLCFGNGIFVAAGTIFDGIWTSADGRHWTKQTGTSQIEHYMSVAYGNGTFVATGAEGPIRTSTDGTNWISTYNSSPNLFLGQVNFGNGLFVAADQTKGQVLVSSNGFDWTTKVVTTNASTAFRGVAYGNGTFIVSSAEGVWQSDHFKLSSVKKMTPGFNGNGMELDLSVETGVPYTVQVSTDLKTWDHLTTFTNTASNTMKVVDTNATTTSRFYRTIAP